MVKGFEEESGDSEWQMRRAQTEKTRAGRGERAKAKGERGKNAGGD